MDAPEIDRRSFIKKLAVGAGVVALAGADVAFAAKTGQPSYEINEQQAAALAKEAEKLIPFITTEPYTLTEEDFQKPSGGLLPKVNLETEKSIVPIADVNVHADVLAHIITNLSYLDGGDTELKKIIEFITKQGLSFSFQSLPSDGNGKLIIPTSTSDSVQIILDPVIAVEYYKNQPSPNSDQAIWHELYHLIQMARDPKFFEQLVNGKVAVYLGAGASAGLYAGKKTYTQLEKSIPHQKQSILSRRGFLRTAGIGGASAVAATLAGVIGAPASKAIGKFVEPKELQAYVQVGMGTKGMMPTNSLEQYRGKLLSFEKVVDQTIQ